MKTIKTILIMLTIISCHSGYNPNKCVENNYLSTVHTDSKEICYMINNTKYHISYNDYEDFKIKNNEVQSKIVQALKERK